MSRDLECTVWCPRCKEEKFRVYREPIAPGGNVYRNVTEPEDALAKTCQCGHILERMDG